tara:strand:- start:488 stop:832 length:345 start_codon:yes stop_codon:yes gene_type:complete
MIFNIKQNHTGNTENELLGHAKTANCKLYKVHSCKITNIDTTDVYVTIKLHDGTSILEIVKGFLIKKGYSIDLFDEPFEYPDKYDLMLALDNAAYAVSWITKTEVLEENAHIES